MLGINNINIGIGHPSKRGVLGPYPAPTGYRWDFVTSSNIIVTSSGKPVVALVRIA